MARIRDDPHLQLRRGGEVGRLHMVNRVGGATIARFWAAVEGILLPHNEQDGYRNLAGIWEPPAKTCQLTVCHRLLGRLVVAEDIGIAARRIVKERPPRSGRSRKISRGRSQRRNKRPLKLCEMAEVEGVEITGQDQGISIVIGDRFLGADKRPVAVSYQDNTAKRDSSDASCFELRD